MFDKILGPKTTITLFTVLLGALVGLALPGPSAQSQSIDPPDAYNQPSQNSNTQNPNGTVQAQNGQNTGQAQNGATQGQSGQYGSQPPQLKFLLPKELPPSPQPSEFVKEWRARSAPALVTAACIVGSLDIPPITV